MNDETKKLTERPATQGEAAELPHGSDARGVSNTPVSAYPITILVRIDYLKLRFDFPFDEFEPTVMEWWNSILDAFLIDRETRVDMRHGGSNYDFGWHYHEDFFVFTGGELTKSHGQPTSMIEMKGMACERFAQRLIEKRMAELGRSLTEAEEEDAVREGWASVVKIIEEFPHRCTRIDLPVDDFGGNVPIVELMRKCRDHEFVSAAKKFFGANGVPLYDMSDDDEAIARDGLGWSFTVGKTESERQICIYDKKAEFTNGHKGVVNANSWIRFESRFKGDQADHMFDCVTEAFKSGDPLAFRKLVIGALTTLIEFKVRRMDGRNTYQEETWPAWAKFVEEGVKPPKFKAKIPVRTVKHNALWHQRDVSRSKFRIRAAYVEDCDGVDAYLICDGMRKADGDDLAIVNASRAYRGLPCYESVDHMREIVSKTLPGDGTISEAVTELFDESKVELVAIQEKPKTASDTQGGAQ